MRLLTLLFAFVVISNVSTAQVKKSSLQQVSPSANRKVILHLVQNDTAATISVFRKDGKVPILTEMAKKDNRPYLHPIIAPDGNGIMTEYRPSHHLHQTGIYWGLKLVNGRDFFMNWRPDYYRRVSANIVTGKGQAVKWQVVYDLLDENGNTVLTETHNWTMQMRNGRYVLDLEWKGEAKTDITFGKYYVGGLFVRMPWKKGISGEIVNAVEQRNSSEAEAQRAIWADVGMQIEGREDMGHIAIFDHPNNKSFPTAWRVDTQLGLGPSRQILGDWKLEKEKTEIFCFRLIIYTGNFDPDVITREWIQFVKEI
jgi:hypothetical protein